MEGVNGRGHPRSPFMSTPKSGILPLCHHSVGWDLVTQAHQMHRRLGVWLFSVARCSVEMGVLVLKSGARINIGGQRAVSTTGLREERKSRSFSQTWGWWGRNKQLPGVVGEGFGSIHPTHTWSLTQHLVSFFLPKRNPGLLKITKHLAKKFYLPISLEITSVSGNLLGISGVAFRLPM